MTKSSLCFTHLQQLTPFTRSAIKKAIHLLSRQSYRLKNPVRCVVLKSLQPPASLRANFVGLLLAQEVPQF